MRFIPARAGNINHRERCARSDAVHPRACGEHQFNDERISVDDGSSPRVRGTFLRGCLIANIRRFIPARAGNIIARPPE